MAKDPTPHPARRPNRPPRNRRPRRRPSRRRPSRRPNASPGGRGRPHGTRLAAAWPFVPSFTTPPPPSYVCLPKVMSYRLNDQDGDCVTAEEAFGKACSGILIADSTVETWASHNDVLNGADLNQVLVADGHGRIQTGRQRIPRRGPPWPSITPTPTSLQAAIALAEGASPPR